MKNKDVIIKEVIIAKNTRFGDSFYQENLVPATHIQFDVVKTITCVIDEANNKAIDLETHDVWDIVKRDIHGKILKEETERVWNEKECALRVQDKNWDKISYLYRLNLIDRAKKVYQRYLDNINESQKVKKIEKRK